MGYFIVFSSFSTYSTVCHEFVLVTIKLMFETNGIILTYISKYMWPINYYLLSVS